VEALTGTAVGTGTLTTQWKTLTVTKATVAGDIHQTLDVHLGFRAQGAFYLEFRVDQITDGSLLFIIPFDRLFVQVDVVLGKNVLGSAAADAVDVGQRDFAALVFR
jgi:hypothetical protein